jgi:hypothetical protein
MAGLPDCENPFCREEMGFFMRSSRMKSKQASGLKILFVLMPILFIALVLGPSSQAWAGVNLEVPLEMIDRGISSHTSTRTHERSAIYFNIAEYDGATVNYYFEIVANNDNTTTAYNVYLTDQTNGVDRLTVPVDPGAVRVRYRFPFTPVAGNNEYCMKVEGTAVVDQVKVFAARIIVVQTNATKTRIQIPLLNHGFNGSANGTTAATDAVTITTYSQNAETRFSLWKKDLSAWGDLAATNPWTFEAVTMVDGSDTSYVSLFNKSKEDEYGVPYQVTDTEVSTTATSMTLLSRDFNDTATNFDDLDDFEVRHRLGTGGTNQSSLSRTALYVRLTNLNKGEVYWRFGRKNEVSANATNNQQRVMLTTDNYSNPQVYHESTGWESVSGVVSTEVFDAGTTDTGTTGSAIAISTIEFDSTSKVRKRNTTDLMPNITSGNRFIRNVTWTSGTIVCASNWLVVKFSAAGCPTPGMPSDPTPTNGLTGVSIDADLDWADATDTESYDVYFGTDPSPPLYAEAVTESSLALPTLEYCTHYYWGIVAKNSCGNYNEGVVWDFTTENGPPGTPIDPDPVIGATGISANALLSWSECTSTDTYEVYLDTNSNPTTKVDETTTNSCDPDLNWDTHYYWKIVAKNSCGSSAESEVWDFTTSPQPAADHFVDADNPNTPVSPYDSWETAARTIQAAINVASAGNTVMVRTGTIYNETVTMRDQVDLIAEEGVKPQIIGSLAPAAISFSGSMSCKLRGFDITYTSFGSVILLNGSGAGITATIEDCDIHNNGLSGINLNGVVSATIKGCNIHNVRGGIVTSGIRGYSLSSGSSVTIKGNTIGGSSSQSITTAGIRLNGSGTGIQVTIGGSGAGDANTISYAGYAGIVLTGIEQAIIENNDISNNGTSSKYAGILLVDVNTVSPHIRNNSIHHHVGAAGINIGGASNVTIGDNNNIYSNKTGIAFYAANNSNIGSSNSSQPVTITGNNIFSNTYAGIAVRDGITGPVTITENNIYSNTRGGIRMQRRCNLTISRNTIRDNLRGGIHTGDASDNGGGFIAAQIGQAVLTIEKNKIHENGQGTMGGGIDVRHASGTIYNNLIYRNQRGGIRFGDYITEIVNNTVVNNGSGNGGGGIVYDNLAGAVNDPPAGNPSAPLVIRNNISAYNEQTGIRACFDNTPDFEQRDYNLVYLNNGTSDDCGWYTLGDVSYVENLRCANKQYGGCGAHTPRPLEMDDPHDIIADPLFVNTSPGQEDYHLQAGSPAKNAGDDGNDMGAYGGDPIDW